MKTFRTTASVVAFRRVQAAVPNRRKERSVRPCLAMLWSVDASGRLAARWLSEDGAAEDDDPGVFHPVSAAA